LDTKISYGWFFTATPFVLRFLMRWSGTNAPDNLFWKFLGYCEYGMVFVWITTIGFMIGAWWTRDKEKTYDEIISNHLLEVRKNANTYREELKSEYVPLKEQISKLKALLEAAEWRARYLERELEEVKANARKTAEDANKEALASVAEV